MKVISIAEDVANTEREVHCPNMGFTSYRVLLERDGMGFAMTKTVIPRGAPQHWHYTRHLEACFCISGAGVLTDLATGKKHFIFPDHIYALDNHDDHTFQAIEDTVLICIFNPPLKGAEVHGKDHSYE
jgi:L-ectoine synthase